MSVKGPLISEYMSDSSFLLQGQHATFDGSHLFHFDCLRDWLRQNEKCPVCGLAITAAVSSQETFNVFSHSACPDLQLISKMINNAPDVTGMYKDFNVIHNAQRLGTNDFDGFDMKSKKFTFGSQVMPESLTTDTPLNLNAQGAGNENRQTEGE